MPGIRIDIDVKPLETDEDQDAEACCGAEGYGECAVCSPKVARTTAYENGAEVGMNPSAPGRRTVMVEECVGGFIVRPGTTNYERNEQPPIVCTGILATLHAVAAVFKS